MQIFWDLWQKSFFMILNVYCKHFVKSNVLKNWQFLADMSLHLWGISVVIYQGMQQYIFFLNVEYVKEFGCR
jgi:hypothetical protein